MKLWLGVGRQSPGWLRSRSQSREIEPHGAPCWVHSLLKGLSLPLLRLLSFSLKERKEQGGKGEGREGERKGEKERGREEGGKKRAEEESICLGLYFFFLILFLYTF